MKTTKTVLILLVALGLFACEKDNATRGIVKYDVIRPNGINNAVDGKIEFSDIFEVSVIFKNAKGENVTVENITLPWSHSQEVKAPFEASIRTRIKLKTLAKEPTEFPEPYAGRITDVYVTANGKTLKNAGAVTGSANKQFKYVQEWLNKNGDKTYKLLFNDNELGKK